MTIPYLHKDETKLMLQVKSDLKRHESFREFAYPDPLSPLAKSQPSKEWGFRPAREIARAGTNLDLGAPWTYGYGFTENVNPDSRISQVQAERKLEEHVLEMNATLKEALPWYEIATFVTKTILINMAFNLGLKGLLKFRNTLAFVKAKDYTKAARNMTLSLWYKQVGSRARELVKRMETQTIEPQYVAPEKIQ